MKYLLDTNVVSELRKPPGKANPNVLSWADAHPVDDFYLSAVTIFEIEIGIRRKERTDAVQAALLRKWFKGQLLVHFQHRMLPIDDRVALAAAAMHVPDPRSTPDSFIAATAVVHGLTVATRNRADFAELGVELLNPWDAEN